MPTSDGELTKNEMSRICTIYQSFFEEYFVENLEECLKNELKYLKSSSKRMETRPTNFTV